MVKHSILEKSSKPLVASLLFPEIQKELAQHPELVGNVKGLFVIIVLQKKVKKQEWYVLLRGREQAPVISQQKPDGVDKSLPVGIIEIEDKDIYKFITGGMYGIKALAQGNIKVAGDLQFANELEDVFYKAGGVAKTKEYLAKALAKKSKL
ncbi:hypothetical protein EDD86DRAFT_197959 [Gorgonomyces haynaldii]|nr:hypothetical protein EDD86DRAFT_197959 [Gorgonomyces haynaldii]